MSFTFQEQRNFIEKHFLKNDMVNHIPDEIDSIVDPFIPNQPPTITTNTTNHENTNTSYKYLDDLMLSNDLVLFPRNLLDEYKIHMCLFSVNTKLETPFLQFMFSKNNSQYTFPSFDLHMKNIQESSVSKIMYSNDDSDSDSDSDQEENNSVNNEFLHQCIRFFHDNILKETDIVDNVDIKTRYRGFMEQDDTNHLYVFFDCTNLHIDVYNDKFKTNECVFALVDEINKRKINEFYIDNEDVTLFKKNPFITELNTRNGEPIIIPTISYICSENDDKNYINIYNDVNENDTDDILLILPQINHPIYHDTYVFSAKALNDNYVNIKRFALFYEDFIHETENMDESSDENDEETEETENMDESSDENDEETEETENMDVSSDESDDELEETENMDESSDESDEETEKTENMDKSSDENDEEPEETENMDESSDENDDEPEETENMDESSDENDEETEETENMDVSSDESDDELEETENMDESSDESDSDMDVPSDESDSDMDVPSDESDGNNMDVILEENVVFTFKNATEQPFYGTYSIETFIEI